MMELVTATAKLAAVRVFVIGGGPEPGLTVSSVDESLAVAP